MRPTKTSALKSARSSRLLKVSDTPIYRRSNKPSPLAFILDGHDVSVVTNKSVSGAFPVDMDSRFDAPYSGAMRSLPRNDYGYAFAFMSCVWAFRAITIRSQKVAELLSHAKLIDTSTGNPVTGTLYQNALRTAFLRYQQDVYEDWEFFKSLTGEAFVELVSTLIEGTQLEFPSHLRTLNSVAVEPVIVGDEIVRYDYNGASGSLVSFDPDEIVFDRTRNPIDDFRGYSLLGAALDAVDVDRSVVIMTKNFYKNNARPGLIFVPKQGKLTQTDSAYIQTFLGEDVKGPQNAGEPLFMPVAMDVIKAEPPTLEDQQILTDEQKARICAAVGMPVALIDFGNMRFQLSDEHRKSLYTETIIPAHRKIIGMVNAIVLPFFDPQGRYELREDLTSIMPIIEDQEKKTTVINMKLGAGYLSFNQAIVEQGGTPVPGGDFFLIPAGSIPVPVSDIGNIRSYLQTAVSDGIIGSNGGSSNQSAGIPTDVGNEKGAVKPSSNRTVTTLDELKTWKKFTLRNGSKKSQRFECKFVPDSIVTKLKEALSTIDEEDSAGIKALFDEAIKAATKSDEISIDPDIIDAAIEDWKEAGMDWLGNQIDDLVIDDGE